MIPAQEIVEIALDSGGGSDLNVVVNESREVNLRWAGNTLTTNGVIQHQDVSIIAFDAKSDGTSIATVTGNVHNPVEVRALVANAQEAAHKAHVAEDSAELIDGGQSRSWTDDPLETSSAQLDTVAAGLGEAFRRGKVDGVEHFGYAEHSVVTTYLGSTTGSRLRHAESESRMEMTAKSHDRTRSAWLGTAEPNMHHLDVATIDADLRRSLAWQGNKIKTAPGRHRVLFSSSAVADLMIELYWAADARSAIEGRSVFSDAGGGTRVGSVVSTTPVVLSSDPHDSRSGMACSDFEVCTAPDSASTPFDNGAGLSATPWISDGRLQHLVTTRRTAELAGIAWTPGIDNLTLKHPDGSGSLEEVALRMGDGLLVNCLWYNRVVDPQTLLLTGLTRDGVYVVRGGEIVGACGNFRFNDSPVSALGRIVDAGSTVRTLAREMGDYFNRAAMPPLVIGDFNLSTASEAR